MAVPWPLRRSLAQHEEHALIQIASEAIRTCRRCPEMLEASLGASAPLVLGAFADKHGPNHGAMWEMVLTYCRRFPGAWDAVDTQKMVVPRLTSFLRCPPYSSLIMCPLLSAQIFALVVLRLTNFLRGRLIPCGMCAHHFVRRQAFRCAAAYL